MDRCDGQIGEHVKEKSITKSIKYVFYTLGNMIGMTQSNVQVTIIAHIDVHENTAPLFNPINCSSDILVACNRLFALS